MNIKIASTEDQDKIVNISYAWCSAMKYVVDKEKIQNEINNYLNNGVVIYIEEDNKILGLIAGKIWQPFWVQDVVASQQFFFVHPNYRNKGYSKILEASFRAWAKSKNCTHVILTPSNYGSDNMEESRHKLESLGYKLHGYQLRREINV